VGVLALWVLVSSAWGWRFAVALLVAVCTGAAALLSWQNRCSGQLGWDGECWHWDTLGDLPKAEESTLSVIVDVQSGLLLLFETAGNTKHWLWVEQVSQPERWMDLRRAVYSPRREDAPFLPPGN
jgi:hypothetical protein